MNSKKLSFKTFVSLIIVLFVVGTFSKSNTQALAATFDDINQNTVFQKQAKGSSTCTLVLASVLIRRAAIMSGNSNWNSISESTMKSTAWVNGVGLKNSFTYAGITVSSGWYNGNTNTLINLLNEHPEGIIIYNTSKPHAILITDYTNGTFYCADPASGYPTGRIPVSQASIQPSSGSKYWYVSSPNLSLMTPSPNVTFDSESVDNLTDTNATISTWVNNEGSITERGFYIGMSDELQNKVVVGTEKVEWTRFREEYNISDYYVDLTPGITYTYVFYVKKGDKEYHSSVGHFTTLGSSDVTFDTYEINNISEDSACISTWFSNPNGYTISSFGFLIGEDFKSLRKVDVFRDIGWIRANPQCEIRDYAGNLKTSTNYVARFYVTIGTRTYYSDFICFSTNQETAGSTIENPNMKPSETPIMPPAGTLTTSPNGEQTMPPAGISTTPPAGVTTIPPSEEPTKTSTAPPSFVSVGYVNKDGIVNLLDAQLVLKVAVGIIRL